MFLVERRNHDDFRRRETGGSQDVLRLLQEDASQREDGHHSQTGAGGAMGDRVLRHARERAEQTGLTRCPHIGGGRVRGGWSGGRGDGHRSRRCHPWPLQRRPSHRPALLLRGVDGQAHRRGAWVPSLHGPIQALEGAPRAEDAFRGGDWR